MSRELRHSLRSLLHQVLALVREPPRAALELAEEDELIRARLVVSAAGVEDDSERYPGRYFSPLERLVWMALASGPLLGKQIASTIDVEYNATLKGVLHNLVERGVLDNTDAGYARCQLRDD